MTADAVGGVFTYARELTSGLADEGFDVVLVVLGPAPSRAQARALGALPLASYHQLTCALEWMPDPRGDVERSGALLLEVAHEEEIDLVHLNGYAHAALAFGVPLLVCGHSCVLSWHEAVRRRPAGPEWNAYRDAVERGLREADVLVAPTQALLDDLVRLYRPSCELQVIPNGLDAVRLRPLAREPYVLGAGRVWDEAKNLLALDRVAPSLPWRVVIAGDAADLEPTSAEFLGHVPAVALEHLLGHAGIYAAPARYEPFGLGVLEAGLAGCPLVLGDIPSLRELWDGAAVFVDPFDDDALRHALTWLIDDEAERARLAVAARRRALGYPRARMAGAYARLYARLTVSAAAPAVAR